MADGEQGRALTEILSVLAVETTELADYARFLNENICELLSDGSTPQHRLALQDIDRLHQHLDEIARALSWLAAPGRATGHVDAAGLSAQMRLGHFRSRLGGTAPLVSRPDPTGDVELF